ncbi:MAG: DHH family phosphoesterase, partial [Lachnospiraceae bacterium]
MKVGNHTFSEIIRQRKILIAAGILALLILLLIAILHPGVGSILLLAACAFLMAACFYLNYKLSRMMLPDTVVQDYPTIRYQLMRELPYPYLLIDENGRILWENRAFARMIYPENARVHNIRILFPELKNADIIKLQEKQQHLQYKDRYYAADFREIRPSSGMETGESDFILAVILADESELQQINQKVIQQKLVIGNIYLDNYDELDGVIDDARLNLVIAHIDRKVTRYFSSYGGIVKKIERDKYFLALPQKNVEEMEKDHFSILDEIRDVKVANEQHITLSIGLGMDSEFSYEKSYENSRAAVEMALGRGGDQVAIKNGEDYTYFGGSAHSVTHTTKVKARVKAHALEELLMNTDTVLIMGHALPDLDAIGAAVGVYRIAVSKGKRAHIILNEVSSSIRPLVEHLQPAN